MAKRKPGSETEDSGADSTQSESSSEFFRFIDLSQNDPASQKRNRTMARSHAMKNVRRRRQTEEKERGLVVLSTKELAAMLKDIYSQTVSGNMSQDMPVTTNPPFSALDADMMPALAFQDTWNPLEQEMIQHLERMLQVPFGVPASLPIEISDLAMEAWIAVRASPMAFHAVQCASATASRNTALAYQTLDLLAHRGEALRLINEEVSRLRDGEEPSDELLLSVLCMATERQDPQTEANLRALNARVPHPFRLAPGTPLDWTAAFETTQPSAVHDCALQALLSRRQLGIRGIANRGIAAMLSAHDAHVAALSLRAPTQPFADTTPVSTPATAPPSVSPSPEPFLDAEPPAGHALQTLLQGSATPLSPALCSALAQLSALLAAPRPATPLRAAAARESARALHHDALSLLPRRNGDDDEAPLAAALRAAVLLLDCGVLHPYPASTGVLQRLVRALRDALAAVVERLGEERGGSAEAVVLWLLFVGGVAARVCEDESERRWFVQGIAALLERKGVRRWKSVKAFLEGFIWDGDSMDAEGVDLWDEVRALEG